LKKLTAQQFKNADMNADGSVTVTDALLLNQIMAKPGFQYVCAEQPVIIDEKRDEEAPYGFRYAYWQCQNGEEEKQGSEASCKSPDTWKKYATLACESKCSSEGKCGLQAISVEQECSLEYDVPEKKEPVNPTCKETDKGFNPEVFGKLIVIDAELLDTCIDGEVLREYYCENDQVNAKAYTCKTGCSDGACLGENGAQRIYETQEAVFSDKAQGCSIGKKFIPPGTRFVQDNIAFYSNCEGGVSTQLDNAFSCKENAQCKSNYCLQGVCQRVQAESVAESSVANTAVVSKQGFFAKINNFFKGLFG
ncbi:MAG: hypothetical protein Q7K43_05485, partial [Candidatus Woesearchaeota archaeon]|nr:hypothetical protein [Candidatus Woesearchaeota archaeon]